jgi:tetratricopeptide (TPR) repeat protein
MSSGDLAGARKAFDAAASAAPDFLPARLSLARLEVSANRWDAARRQVNAALAIDRRDPAALLLAADIELTAGDRAASIAKYRSVLDVDGSNVAALNNLAYVLGAENPDEALKLAQQALALAPDNAAVEDTLGWVYYRKGMYDRAVTYLKRAVARESTPRRQFHLASSYMKTGDRNLGQSLMAAALKQDPNLLKTEQGW